MDWFLIRENEHLGPFDSQTLEELYQDGEFNEEALLWKEGWADTKTYAEVFLTDGNSDELPPELPPELLPVHAGVVDKKPPLPQETNHEVPRFSKEVIASEESAIAKPKTVTSEETVAPVEIDFNEYEFEYDKSEKSALKRLRVLAIVSIFLIVVTSGLLYFFDREVVFDRPSTMSLGDFERLVATAKSESSELRFSFALASDKRTLWAATNNPLEGEVYINLESKKGRVLGRDVEVKAKGDLKKKLISFKDFQFIKGNKFIDGYYDVEIYTVDDLEVPLFQKLFKPTDKQFRFINEYLITSLVKVDFEKQLSSFSKRQDSNSKEFWVSIYQKYKTMIVITKKIESGFQKVLQAKPEDWHKAIKQFKSEYSREYGVFFTSFVRSNEASYERLVKREFEDQISIMSNFQQLSELSKKIGSESMELLSKLETIDPTEVDTSKLEQDLMKPFLEITQECERRIAILESKV